MGYIYDIFFPMEMKDVNLFIDVDYTLIDWHTDEAQINQNVLDFIKYWANQWPESTITVWSLGGQEYAQAWANEVLGKEITNYICIAKYPRIPLPNELYVDDSPLESYARLSLHPKLIGDWISRRDGRIIPIVVSPTLGPIPATTFTTSN